GAQRPWHALADDDEREVPRRDDADNACRLAQDEAEPPFPDIVVGLAFQPAGLPGRIAPEVGAERNLAPRLPDRLAGLEAFDQRQFVLVGEDQRRDAVEDGGALAAAHPGPGTVVERGARRADRQF